MDFDIINPTSTKELLGTLKKLQKEKFRFGAGYTDLLMELKKNPEKNLTIINLSRIKDAKFSEIKKSGSYYRFGAMLTAHKIVINEELKNSFPVLHEAASNLASTQIRQVATIGGNICTSSPSGDIACALVALEAKCEILNQNGKTSTVLLKDFFIGPRKNILNKNELLYGIIVPAKNKNTRKCFSGFLKIGTRNSMECSVVSLAFHIQANDAGKITHAGVAIGASAPTIRLAETACNFLLGKNIYKISEIEKQDFADKVLSYASPISDLRATAWYRKEVLHNISKSIFE